MRLNNDYLPIRNACVLRTEIVHAAIPPYANLACEIVPSSVMRSVKHDVTIAISSSFRFACTHKMLQKQFFGAGAWTRLFISPHNFSIPGLIQWHDDLFNHSSLRHPRLSISRKKTIIHLQFHRSLYTSHGHRCAHRDPYGVQIGYWRRRGDVPAYGRDVANLPAGEIAQLGANSFEGSGTFWADSGGERFADGFELC